MPREGKTAPALHLQGKQAPECPGLLGCCAVWQLRRRPQLTLGHHLHLPVQNCVWLMDFADEGWEVAGCPTVLPALLAYTSIHP